jgi:hypothetical protein
VVLRPTRRPDAFCQEYLEPGVFSPRIASLFESALTGDLDILSAVVFSRTSEQDYKAYLYVREVVREGRGTRLPPLWLHDVLNTSTAQAHAYGLARTRELVARLESLAGRAIRPGDVETAVAESNAARAAVRRLLALRTRALLHGTEALALVGSFFLMDRARYAHLAHDAADAIEHGAPVAAPRLVVAGAWLDHPRLHALLESHGAIVVGEDGGWGSRAAGRDIQRGGDLVAGTFEKYYRDGPSVRQSPSADRSWLDQWSPADIDGVVFYLPPDDSVAGWDAPRERGRLEGRGIPCHEPIEAFLRGLRRAH